MRQFDITGMSCSACSARIEKAVSSLSGVTECSVNLLTNSMTVSGTAKNSEIIKAVENAGYGVSLKDANNNSNSILSDTETSVLRKRLVSSLIFLILLMYVSMGHVMWGFPLPSFLAENHFAIGVLQFMLTVIVMVINKKFFINGFKSLFSGAPNMDTLVALGSSAAFIYSTCVLIPAAVDGHHFLHDLYFESAAMIPALITLGKMLESYSKGKTTNALRSLMDLAPKTAIVEINGEETEVPAKDIKVGDIFIVKSGGSFPVDGVIISGNCAADESAITGESIPIDKIEGDYVTSATINKSGFVRCRAEKVGNDTTISQIIKLVSDASSSKAPISRIADKVSGIFVPVVSVIAVITTLIWLVLDYDIGFAIARGISVLVISCPCALGLATPVAIMVANGVGAKNGILFKNAVSLETAGKVSVVALDKTGTITKGKPVVTDIVSATTNDELLKYAYSLELKSEHPLALAVVEYAKENDITSFDCAEFNVSAGNGLEGLIEDAYVFGGNIEFISKICTIPDDFITAYKNLSEVGKTPLFFAKDDTFLGIIAVADEIKEYSPDAINELKNMGIKVVMLTGDNENTANSVKDSVGIDEVFAGVKPDEKAKIVHELKRYGKVCMVGDGINDAPALASSDVAIAIGAGTDIAIDSADIVLTKSSIKDVAATIRLSRMTLKNIYENLFWAFIYNTIGIPVAAGILIPFFNIALNPMFAAAAMSLSSFCVVTNALRLNLKDIKNPDKDKKIRQKERKLMETVLKIEGMMCPHCEARVKEVLEAIDGVAEVIPSHVEKTAIVKTIKEIDVKVLKDAVEKQGYKIIE